MCYAAKGGLGRLQDGSGQTANEGGVRMGNDQEIGRGGLANGSVKIQETVAEKSANTRALQRWNVIHSVCGRAQVQYDDWLETFQGAIARCQTPIIDLGCGSGNDTLYLIERGKRVIACDYAQNAIRNIRKNFPEVERAVCFDMAEGLPFGEDLTDLVICDLSLHYFTEQTTFAILDEIKRVLRPGGLLLFRVNSVRDVNHGAGMGREVEHHLYETQEWGYKRYFDLHDINKFWGAWDQIYLQEEAMHRYELEKVLWKGAVVAGVSYSGCSSERTAFR